MDVFDSSSSDSENEERVSKKIYRPRINFELDDFISRFRLSRTAVESIILNIGDRLEHNTDKNMALSPTQQLLLAFRYLAGGGLMLTIGDAHGPVKSTVSRSVHAVVSAINDHYFNDVVKWPNNIEEVVASFYKIAHMPCCVGAIDGSHVQIKKPYVNENQYVNRHGVHSINTMMVAGPKYQFYYVSVKRPGSVNDSRVLRLSTLADRFIDGWRPFPNAVLLGDSGYGLSEWLMTPILAPQTTAAEDRYNRVHKRTRNVVECAFGVLKKRYGCLQKLRLSPEFAADVIKTCTILHNLALQYTPLEEDEVQGILREIENRQNNADDDDDDEDDEDDEIRNAGETRRNQLVAYFRL